MNRRNFTKLLAISPILGFVQVDTKEKKEPGWDGSIAGFHVDGVKPRVRLDWYGNFVTDSPCKFNTL